MQLSCPFQVCLQDFFRNHPHPLQNGKALILRILFMWNSQVSVDSINNYQCCFNGQSGAVLTVQLKECSIHVTFDNTYVGLFLKPEKQCFKKNLKIQFL